MRNSLLLQPFGLHRQEQRPSRGMVIGTTLLFLQVVAVVFGPASAGVSGHSHGDDDADGEGGDPNSTQVIMYKVMSIATLFAMATAFAFAPLVIPKARMLETAFVPIANVGAAGVFLTIGLAHILPEAAESLGKAFGEEDNDQFRIAYMIAVLGYLMVLALQKVVPLPGQGEDDSNVHGEGDNGGEEDGGGAYIRSYPSPKNRDEDDDDDVGDDGPVYQEYQEAAPQKSNKKKQGQTNNKKKIGGARRESLDHKNRQDTEVSALLMESSFHQDREGGGGARAAGGSLTATGDPGRSASQTGGERQAGTRASSRRFVAASVAALGEGTSRERSDAKIRAYALMVALLVHSFSAGAALGVQSSKKGVLGVFVALIAHKWAEALTLGISIVKAPSSSSGSSSSDAGNGGGGLSRCKQIVVILVFAIGTPLGIGVGMLAEAVLPAAAEGILMALSTGTFIYIGASEVVAEEFAVREYGLWKLLSFVVGAMIIFLTTAYADAD